MDKAQHRVISADFISLVYTATVFTVLFSLMNSEEWLWATILVLVVLPVNFFVHKYCLILAGSDPKSRKFWIPGYRGFTFGLILALLIAAVIR